MSQLTDKQTKWAEQVLGKNLFGRKAGYLASLLLSISPFSIYYSQVVRPYTAIGFFTLLGAYSLLMILQNPERKYKYSIIYIISNVLNVYFHWIAILVLISLVIFLALKIRKHRHLTKPFILIHLIIIFLIWGIDLINPLIESI